MSISSSSSSTVGPYSMISVWLPFGSMTAVDVRDSRRIRTKSFRMPSLVRPSMIDVPVRPPASPVAITGSPSRLSVRAMLMPLPPARASASEARLRVPDWKFGTVSVRSNAALSVTVTITRGRRLGRERSARRGCGRPGARARRPRACPACTGAVTMWGSLIVWITGRSTRSTEVNDRLTRACTARPGLA